MFKETNMQVEQNIGLSGRVGWEIINSDGSTHSSSDGLHKNLILNQGLDKLGATGGANQGEGLPIAEAFTYCAVGTSNATPDVSQNGFMTTEVTRTNNYLTSGGGCGTNYTNTYTMVLFRTFDFPVGTFNGDLLAEVGFSNLGTKADNLFSRTLFKDGLGNPVVITVTNTQILRVRYELTITVDTDTSWKAGSFNITGIGTVGFQKRFQSFERYISGAGSLPLLREVGSNGVTTGAYYHFDFNNVNDNITFAAYSLTAFPNKESLPSPGSRISGYSVVSPPGNINTCAMALLSKSLFQSLDWKRDYTFKLSTNDFNYSISCFALSAASFQPGGWVFYLDTPITKDSLHELTVTVRVTWGRA